MKNAIFLLSLLLIVIGCKDKYELSKVDAIYLNTEIGNVNGGNAVKLFHIASDTTNNKVYVQSIIGPHIAVINADNGELEKYIDTEIEDYHLSRMAVQNSTGNLFIADEKSKKLIKIDTSKEERTKDEYNFNDLGSSAVPGRLAVFDSKNLVVVSLCNQNRLVFIDTNSLTYEGELNIDDGIYCPKGIKIRNEKIYVALSRNQADNYDGARGESAVAIIEPNDGSISSWSVEHLSVAPKGAEEIAVDVANGRFWLLNDSKLRYVDMDGNKSNKSSEGIEFRNIQYSKAMNKLILLTRDGADSTRKEGAYGSIELFEPEEDISDLEASEKYRTGFKSNSLALIGSLQKIYVSNMGDGTVSVIDYSEHVDNDNKIEIGPKTDLYLGRNISDITYYANQTNLIDAVGTSTSTYDKTSKLAGSQSYVLESTVKYNYKKEDSETLKFILDKEFISIIGGGFNGDNLFKDGLELYQDMQFKDATDSIDIGTSIEDIIAHPDGDKVYIVNRLGGSQILVYTKSTDSVKQIDVSNWPTRLALDEDRRELYVYSHFASKVDIIDIDSNTFVSSIDLTDSGVEQGRTHFIPEITYDQGRNALFIAIPEQGLIVEVNTSSQTVTQIKNDFTSVDDDNSNSNVGTVQVAVDGYSRKLIVYYRDEKLLKVLNPLDSLSEVQEICLNSKDDLDGSFAGDVLKMDAKNRRIFVGPHAFSISAGKLTDLDTKVGQVEKIIGIQDDYILGVKESNNEITVYAYEIKSDTNYDKIMSDTVSDMKVLPPRFAVDEGNEYLYVGYMERAKLKIYELKEK